MCASAASDARTPSRVSCCACCDAVSRETSEERVSVKTVTKKRRAHSVAIASYASGTFATATSESDAAVGDAAPATPVLSLSRRSLIAAAIAAAALEVAACAAPTAAVTAAAACARRRDPGPISLPTALSVLCTTLLKFCGMQPGVRVFTVRQAVR